MIHASAIAESIVASTLFRPAFLHSLDPQETFGINRLTLRPDVLSLSYTRVWEETGPMAAERVQRRLAAILAADVEGYRQAMPC